MSPSSRFFSSLTSSNFTFIPTFKKIQNNLSSQASKEENQIYSSLNQALLEYHLANYI
jgi:hypothetical protein